MARSGTTAHLPNHFMPGLPKIALARLRAKPGAPKSSGGPEGQAGSPSARHPDANLLAAFAEKTLTERERTRVLHHLATCADCREVAAFALPEEAAAAEPVRVAAGPRWSLSLVLRWGAMAAVLGTLAVVVVLHPGMWKGQQEISKITPPPAPAGYITSAPQTVSPSPSAPPPSETARAMAQGEPHASAGEMAASQKASGQRQDLALNDHVARNKAKQHVTLMEAVSPPATVRAENNPAANTEREEKKEGNALAAGDLPGAPAPSAPAAVTTAASEDATKASAGPQAVPAMMRATTQSVAVTGGSAGGISAGAAAAKSPPPAPSRASMRMTAQAPMDKVQAFRTGGDSEAGPPAALWSVASDGQVQRSTDGGKSFEQIPVAKGIKFHSIAALGNDVWTGGARGALFHSVDGGATWTRVALNFGGKSETITGIQLHDPQHLTLTTASGSQWVSEDGGQHWQKP
ncbi:MAG: YCF48-related protein [Terriglobia bacterium]